MTEAEKLEHDAEDARLVWQEAARVLALHRELASLYRSKRPDLKRIQILWRHIEQGEADLRMLGIHL